MFIVMITSLEYLSSAIHALLTDLSSLLFLMMSFLKIFQHEVDEVKMINFFLKAVHKMGIKDP